MILGAQLYSLREQLQTKEAIEAGFCRLHDMGYEAVQVSGIRNPDPILLKQVADKYSLPITVTHSPFDRILHDTDALIEEHKIMACPVIGLGCMPGEYRDGTHPTEELLQVLEEPIRKIRAAGLRFGYHNHWFDHELVMTDGTVFFDTLVQKHPEIDIILDVYWAIYAGRDPLAIIPKLKGRLANVHFKDMAKDETRDFCPCGTGRIDFVPIANACREAGVQVVQVEQDNATGKPDPFGEMETSCRFLTKIVHE